MRKKYANQHVMNRDAVYYYVRHNPHDLAQHYFVDGLCFSLRTKSLQSANRAAKSVSQRLEDYWLGLRLQQMATLSYRTEESYWSRSVLIPIGGIHPILEGSMNIDYGDANFYRTTDINDQWIDVNADELRNLGELIRGVYKI